MYARVTTYRGTVEDFDWAKALLEAQLKERTRQLVGCSGVLLMIDRSSGESLSITLWDDEEAMARSRPDGQDLRQRAAWFSGATVADVAEYEVPFAEIRRPAEG
jgi:hypothetical protein